MRGEPEGSTASVWRRLAHLWTLSRPRFWAVSALPAYVGYVLAADRLVPAPDRWRVLLAALGSTPSNPGRVLDAAHAALTASADLLVALVVLGPLSWTATLLLNDAYDVTTDRRNPRKASSPLVQGLVSAGWARRVAYGAGLAALAASILVHATFTLLVAAALALAWAYSAPPLRLKARPGMDVAVNAIGIGVLSGMAGWSLAAPLSTFPFALLPQGLLVAVAIYVPTTLVDVEADRAAGETTLPVAVGVHTAYRIGWWAWVAANAGAVLLASLEILLPRSFLPVLVVFVPLMLWEYRTFIDPGHDQAEQVRGHVRGREPALRPALHRRLAPARVTRGQGYTASTSSGSCSQGS